MFVTRGQYGNGKEEAGRIGDWKRALHLLTSPNW